MEKVKKIVILTIVFLSIFVIAIFGFSYLGKTFGEKKEKGFVASNKEKVSIYDETYQKKMDIARGTNITIYEKEYMNEKESYKKIKTNKGVYYIRKENVTTDEKKVIIEKVVYVRTPAVVYFTATEPDILLSVKKGTELQVLGYDKISEDGKVDKYHVEVNGKSGYIRSKYVLQDKVEALKNYNENGIYDIHSQRGNVYGGGSAANLDYYKEDKIKIKGNPLPKETRTLYINATSVSKMDDYIQLAKQSNINAFVIDVKENTVPSYASPVMQTLSHTSYMKAVNKLEDYKTSVDKAKKAGIYIIGRITVFKDQYYALDHPEDAIIDTRTGKPFSHNHSYWPTPYNRKVWEYNVKIAKEAVKEFGFNEIQFDYVRFPDQTGTLEANGIMDMRNTGKEEKAQVLQQFLMYARDEIHEVGAYISADVFGESANNYVTAYGQYWPAISNVVDVISAMPYPDHFNKNEFGISAPVWTVPYQLLKTWGTSYASVRQTEIPSPAIARTWIQAYNAIQEPYIVYDATKIEEQIKGLYESGLNGGYITWNAGSSLDKYKQLAPAFKKDYINE